MHAIWIIEDVILQPQSKWNSTFTIQFWTTHSPVGRIPATSAEINTTLAVIFNSMLWKDNPDLLPVSWWLMGGHFHIEKQLSVNHSSLATRDCSTGGQKSCLESYSCPKRHSVWTFLQIESKSGSKQCFVCAQGGKWQMQNDQKWVSCNNLVER